jgi:hypothetical protein
LVVLPGSLGIGECTTVDLQDRTIEAAKLE